MAESRTVTYTIRDANNEPLTSTEVKAVLYGGAKPRAADTVHPTVVTSTSDGSGEGSLVLAAPDTIGNSFLWSFYIDGELAGRNCPVPSGTGSLALEDVLAADLGADYDVVAELIAGVAGVTDHTELDNIGTNTHAQIDAHIADTTNPHSVTAAQLGALTSVAAADITDATADGIALMTSADANAFTDADEAKLDGIEAGATADQTGAEIKAAYEAEADTNAFDDAAVTKLAGIEAGADVTDATNVAAAGALMADGSVTGATGQAQEFTSGISINTAGESDLNGLIQCVDLSTLIVHLRGKRGSDNKAAVKITLEAPNSSADENRKNFNIGNFNPSQVGSDTVNRLVFSNPRDAENGLSNDRELFAVYADGAMTFGGTEAYPEDAQFYFKGQATLIESQLSANVTLALRLHATQSANAFEINTNGGSGGDVVAIAADGDVTLGGSEIAGVGDSSTTSGTAMARLEWSWNDSTHATRSADVALYATDYGAEREGLRVRATGTAAAIGFLGATPAARQAHIADVSTGTDAAYETAINSILAVLETFGLTATS